MMTKAVVELNNNNSTIIDNNGDKKDVDTNNSIVSSHIIATNNITTNDSNTTTNNNGIDAFLQRLDDDVDIQQMKKNKGLSSKRSKIHSSNNATTTTNNNEYEGGNGGTNITKVIKKISFTILLLLLLYLMYDTITSSPESRLLSTTRINMFLLWIQDHPTLGGLVFILAYATCVILLLPGTPLTLGCGYVYKVSYGWTLGLVIGTTLSTCGSLLGSVTSFLLGRYALRTRVRNWGRKHYPLFDILDGAVSDNGFKIMCLLYLTPILPLGPVSYICGTTSMPLIKFASAKIACVPLMLLYTFIGASTDTFFTGSSTSISSSGSAVTNNVVVGKDTTDDLTTITSIIENSTAIMPTDGSGSSSNSNSVKYNIVGSVGGGVDDETHRKMVLFGLLLSIISMSIVSYFVKKELYKIFDQQKREKKNKGDEDYDNDNDSSRHNRRLSSSIGSISNSGNNNNNTNVVVGDVEMRRRPRGQAEDIEKG
jgi:uncharacterized membrane protein YdjX (TVP38/TMEM64 family)